MTTYEDTDVSFSDEVKQFARLFYLKLYDNFDSNLDEARAHAFSTTKADLRCFHPTEDSFHYHMLRALSEFSFTKLFSRITPTYPSLHNFREGFVVTFFFNRDGQTIQTSSGEWNAILYMCQEEMHKEMLMCCC